MVFGVYSVDNDKAQVKELRKKIAAFIKSQDHIKSYHAVYIDKKENRIYCDFMVDYELRSWEDVEKEFKAYMDGLYPGYSVELTIETEFV